MAAAMTAGLTCRAPTDCSTSALEELSPHSPLYFNQTSVPFDYDPLAPPPEKWLAAWTSYGRRRKAGRGTPPSTRSREWFGYIVSGRTDLHKIFLQVGPTRGGKGTIARILTALIGKRNACGPTLNSLGGEFGLAPLIGKSLAVISDVRFTGKGTGVVVERLLSISGEDMLTVNVKFKEQWCGLLPARLHILSNELPRLADASVAIVGRLVVLMTERSWLGRENYKLEGGLRTELTGILNWALRGLHRLTFERENQFTPVPRATPRFSKCAISPRPLRPLFVRSASVMPLRKSRSTPSMAASRRSARITSTRSPRSRSSGAICALPFHPSV